MRLSVASTVLFASASTSCAFQTSAFVPFKVRQQQQQNLKTFLSPVVSSHYNNNRMTTTTTTAMFAEKKTPAAAAAAAPAVAVPSQEELKKLVGYKAVDDYVTSAQANAQSFVDTLMSTSFETIPNCDNKIKVLRNIPELETGRKGSIIVRSVTELFWTACINKVDTPNSCFRVAAVGTPGIGKTTTTPILIRMLLERKKTVVYLIRTQNKERWYYEFTPSNTDGTVAARVYPESAHRGTIISLTKEETYYIVDPGNTRDSCDPPADFFPKVIIVASPDEGHWGASEFEKRRNVVEGYFKIHPIWSLNELLAVRQEFGNFDEDQIRDRYRIFGGVPRRVFAKDIQKDLESQDTAIFNMKEEHVTAIALGRMDAVGSFGTNAPKGIILAFVPGNESTFTRVQQSSSSQLLSPVIREKISSLHMVHLWNIMVQKGVIIGRALFEPYVRYLIQNRSLNLECRYISTNITTVATIPRCTTIRLVADPAAIVDSVDCCTLLHSSEERYPLIDCIFKDEQNQIHAIQITTGKSHSIDATKITDLYATVFSLEPRNARKIRLYYFVPSENFSSFTTNPRNPVFDPEKFDVVVASIPDPSKS